MFQAIEIEFTVIKITSHAITVMLNFQKRAILRHLEKVNRDNGSQEDPGVVNIVFKCPDCNQKERDDILEIIGHKMFSCAVL